MHAGRYAQDVPRDARMAERNRNDGPTDNSAARGPPNRSLRQDMQQHGRGSMLRTSHCFECAFGRIGLLSIHGAGGTAPLHH